MSLAEQVAAPEGPAEPFLSLADLRREHVVLLSATRAPAPDPAAQQMRVERIRAFMRRVSATGRRLEDLEQRDAAQAILDYWDGELLSGASRARAAGARTVLQKFDLTQQLDMALLESPYMGLSPFQEKDRAWFFGREQAIDLLCQRVAASRMVIVHGPSGTGKSSLVQAGLIPRLKDGIVIPGSEAWRYVAPFVPGTDPLAALAAAIAPAAADKPAEAGQLARDPDRLRSALGRFPPCVLVVDQLEELFSLVEAEATQRAFVAALASLAADPEAAHRVILIVREDFVSRLMQCRPVAALQSRTLFSPPALDNRELRAVIEEPAKRVNLRFEDGIVADLVSDVVGEQTPLPLLQFTLTQLWSRREGSWISWKSYTGVGRPLQALKNTAENVYSRLDGDDARATAQRLFLNLVRPAGGTELVRRRMSRQALAVNDDTQRVDAVLQRWVDAGLIRRTEGSDAEQDRFEVAHETLLRNWPRLIEWLNTNRRESERAIQLINTTRLWLESGSKRGFLLTGKALADAKLILESSHELRDNANVRDFIRSSERFDRRFRWVAAAALIIPIAFGVGVLIVSLLNSQAQNEQLSELNARLSGLNAELTRQRDALKAEYELQQSQFNDAIRARDAAARSQDRLHAAEQAFSTLVRSGKITAQEVPAELRSAVLGSQAAQPAEIRMPNTLPYAPAFLGVPVALPTLPAVLRARAFEGGRPLDYYHYSVAFDLVRRTAIYAASNFDRTAPTPAESKPGPFLVDPRLPSAAQLDPAFFRGDDRRAGLLVSRTAVAWGANPGVAEDSVSYAANLVPQSAAMNRAWLRVTRWLLLYHNANAQRVTLLSGPVLRDDDPVDNGVRIPRAFWIAAISRRSSSQDLVIDSFLLEASKLDETETSQDEDGASPPARSSLAEIEQVTGLDFGDLKRFEPAAATGAPASRPTVYFQFRGGMSRDSAKEIARALQDKGFNVPGEEQVGPGTNPFREVRYFNLEDRAAAERLATVTQAALAVLGFGDVPVRVQDFTGYKGNKLAKGTVELWLDLPAPGLAPIAWSRAPAWLKVAFGEVGVMEQPGSNNPRIMEYQNAVPALAGRGQDVPWSSSFPEWVMNQVGISGPKSGLNRSWLTWGREQKPPMLGCVAVFWRTSPQSRNTSIGFYLGEDKDSILILAGNITNAVAVIGMPRERYLECRMPPNP